MPADPTQRPREALGGATVRTEDCLAALDAMAEVDDPAERAATLTRYLTACAAATEYLSACRTEALREWRRHGASYDEVARRLGVSKSRAQQLCAGLPRGD